MLFESYYYCQDKDHLCIFYRQHQLLLSVNLGMNDYLLIYNLQDMEQLLMTLDVDAPDPEELNSIFRAAHSIKGGSGIFGFDALMNLTHVMENLLDKARNQEIQVTAAIVDIFLDDVNHLGIGVDRAVILEVDVRLNVLRTRDRGGVKGR